VILFSSSLFSSRVIKAPGIVPEKSIVLNYLNCKIDKELACVAGKLFDGKLVRRKTVGGNVVCRARDPRSDSRPEHPPESDAGFARARALVADFRFYDFGAGLESAGTPVAGHFLLDRLHLAHLYRPVARIFRSAGPAIASAASGARIARKIGRGPPSPRLWRGRATDKIDVKGLTAR
jgi:hypothetical protein